MAKVHPATAVEEFPAEDLRDAAGSPNDASPYPSENGDAVAAAAQASEEGEQMQKILSATVKRVSQQSGGTKICMLQCGSRGDAQPIIALSAHLKAAGFNVLVLGTINAQPFMETFGVDCIPVHPDSEAHFREDKAMRDSMASGKLLPMLNGSGKRDAVEWPITILKQYEHIKTFQPDLLCCSYVDLLSGQLFKGIFQIPCIMLWLQPLIPSKYKKSPFNEGILHYSCWIAALKLAFDGYQKKKYPIIEAQLGKLVPDVLSHVWPNVDNFMDEMMKNCITPQVCGFDEALYAKAKDWPKHLTADRFSFQGFWVVSPKEQERRMDLRDPAFGGTDIEAIKDFLAASDEEPIYLGWGSMVAVSPEYMIQFAVRTLMKLRKRGIVLGGFARLHDRASRQASVAQESDEAEVTAYMAENVIFVGTAPHEWLFPRCAASVHHGGSGTTAVALRSGKPTVITPCFLDQFGNAEMVERCGCGIRCKQFIKATVDQLAKALTTCLEDTALKNRCAAMGKRLREVDSCDTTAAFIDKFYTEEVVTGRWKWKAEEEREKRLEMRKRYPKGKKSVLRHMCCGSMNPS